MATFTDSNLHESVISNNISEVLSVLKNAPGRLGEKDGNGYTPLMLASGYGHAEMVGSLLKMYFFPVGSDLDEESTSGYTALALAVDRGHIGIVAALLDAGADACVRCGSGGYTSLHLAVKNNNYDMMKRILVVKRDGSDAMIKAVTNDGRTPLAIYCSNKNNVHFNSSRENLDQNTKEIENVLKLLITDYRSAVDQADSNGVTPLMHAVLIGEAPLVRLLLQQFGADTTRTTTDEGLTAEVLASQRGYVDIVSLLSKIT